MAAETTGLLAAMLAVQSAAPTLKKTASNPAYKGSKYAPLDEVVETIGPILAAHGLVWTTKPSFNEAVGPTLRYKIAHAPSGEEDEGEMPLLLSKQDAQGQGSAITYARRYALCAYLNLVADDDDDGNRAAQGHAQGNGRGASEKQVSYIRKLLKEKKLTAAQIRILLEGAGVQDTSNVVDAVGALTGSEASKVLDALVNGPVKTGESDVPGAGLGDFEHPPADEGEPLFDPGVPG